MYLINKLKKRLYSQGFFSLMIHILKYPFLYGKRKSYKKMLTKKDIKDRFITIYEENLWQSKESISGEGSEISYTKPLREWMLKEISQLNIKVFVDAPCGDFNWMKTIIPKLSIKYIGLDIVPSLINSNKIKYESKNVYFNVANICDDPLPDCDMIMVRDCLFHLSYEDINKFLKNLDKTNYNYLFTSTHLNENLNKFSNKDILTGDFRYIDLFSKPFNFNNSNIYLRVEDYIKGSMAPKEMILIEKKYVPKSIFLN
tara:strand:+ start:155 stop:925 length:771 start_codon:yes stop_codon:yes gene_type:complete